MSSNIETNNQPVSLKEAALRGDIILVTKGGANILNEQIIKVNQEKDEVVLAMGKSANLDPDLKENNEFRRLRNKAQFDLPQKLSNLKKIIEKIVIYQENNPNTIDLGDEFSIDLYFPGNKQPEFERCKLVSPIEIDYHNENNSQIIPISYLSPMGKAIWGQDKQAGTNFFYDSPMGKIKCIIRNNQ